MRSVIKLKHDEGMNSDIMPFMTQATRKSQVFTAKMGRIHRRKDRYTSGVKLVVDDHEPIG